MKTVSGKLVYAPTDLSTFFNSPYVSWLHHHNQVVPAAQKVLKAEDPQRALLGKKGEEFEAQHLGKLKSPGKSKIVEIDRTLSFDDAHQATIAAMKKGADIIYQAALKHGEFAGYADFLQKVTGKKSSLGDYCYEVSDTKLSRSAKPEYALQVCCYSEMVAAIQGVWPDKWHLHFGDGTSCTYAMSDFRYYYTYFKSVFLEYHRKFSLENRPFPETWEQVAGYEDHVEELYKKIDHVCQVAGVTQSQMKRLAEVGITTRAELASAAPSSKPKKMQERVFSKIVEQAQLQIESEKNGKLSFRILSHTPGVHEGLARIPAFDEGDIFFDMEGYPLEEGGFEYMYGALFLEKDKWIYKEFTARDKSEEREVFEAFMDWTMERFSRHPGLHIYHYANYEKAALSNLSNLYASRVAEIDCLLKNKVFVDLYQVVREGVRVGAPSYSIKKVEALYGFKRRSDVTTAGDSVVQFHNFLELRAVDPAAAEKVLSDIIAYNKEDVESTLGLLEWLRGQQKAHGIASVLASTVAEPVKPTPDWAAAREAIHASPPAWVKTDEDRRVSELIGDLIGYFDREDRPVWWAYFERQKSQPSDLYHDAECIAVARAVTSGPSGVTIQFDPAQPLKVKEGQSFCLHGADDTWTTYSVTNLDLNAGTATVDELQLSEGADLTLIPGSPIPTKNQKDCLTRLAANWQQKPAAQALTSAALDLLYRRPPRVKGIAAGAELYPASEQPLSASLRLVKNLDHSCLSIQGPPGTGKTYTGGYVIAHLLKLGKRVAVVSQGKKTVDNLLESTVDAWKRLFPADPLPAILMADGDLAGKRSPKGYSYKSNSDASRVQGQYQLVGATHFVWAKPQLANGGFDYLFIDEAGQFALAAAIVCSYVAKNLVLLGDQMQLEQVNVGSHPGSAELSVLNYYMQGMNTIPRTHGVFLDETYRMNPSISNLLSELIYDGRLKPHQQTHGHNFDIASKQLGRNGILFHSVDHQHNSMRSEEEADEIEKIIKILQSGKLPGPGGKLRKFKGDAGDLIVISPYNAQVELIRSRINGVKVGSVDLFQGQEAWISILSMCASGEEDLHRGLDFLLSKNRINVGLSRAKALSIIVGSPKLLEIRPRSMKSMTLLNFYSALVHR